MLLQPVAYHGSGSYTTFIMNLSGAIGPTGATGSPGATGPSGSSSATIVDTNVSNTYYPVFATGTGTVPLNINMTSPFSVNPVSGEFIIDSTVKVEGGPTGSIAIGYQAGQTGQGNNTGNSGLSIAVGVQAGQYNQYLSSIAIGYQAGQTGQGYNSDLTIAAGSSIAIGVRRSIQSTTAFTRNWSSSRSI